MLSSRLRPARRSVFALPLAALLLAGAATAQVFPSDAWLFRQRIDAATAANTSLAVLGAADDPLGNDAAIAVRCAGAAGGFQVFLDFDAFHGNEGIFEVRAAWDDEAAAPLELATSADLSAGFVLEADESAFVDELRAHRRLEVQLTDAAGATTSYRWTPPLDASALTRLNCLSAPPAPRPDTRSRRYSPRLPLSNSPASAIATTSVGSRATRSGR